MAIAAIPVDQRVIDIDSRRFASIEKALVELITNSDESYTRLEKSGSSASGRIRITYERHQGGALLVIGDQAEGMSFEQVRYILAYGAAHSPLSRGEGEGRGYFGRGLKQAIYGLGHGWIETIRDGRYSRIELFRSGNGGYLYDDLGGDRPASAEDRERLGIIENGTQVSIVVENIHVNISQFRTLLLSVASNIYLREILLRRKVEIINVQQGKVVESSGKVCYEEPSSSVLLGPDAAGRFVYEGVEYPFALTLKRAYDAELILRGDERTNGLLVVSGLAVLDCQLFDYENQVGTEYLFGSVRCPALIEKLGQGWAVISDEREGLNTKDPFVAAFAHAVSLMIAPYVEAEQEKLKHLDHATTSGRTSHMIDHLLERMNRAAVQDFGIIIPSSETGEEGDASAALRFTTPFYYRKTGHPFHVALLIDKEQFSGDEELRFEYDLPDSISIEPLPELIAAGESGGRFEWTLMGGKDGEQGRITVRGGASWAWCEIAVSDNASGHSHGGYGHGSRKTHPRDHGMDMFGGYEFRNLNNDLERAVYSPQERKILINTAAPTVQLYVDGRGHFRDSARLLLAELFMDVISDELARCSIEKSGRMGDGQAYHLAKQEIVRRYGSEIHLSFLNG